ncbi:response regulator transcription factor [Paenibacillus prosopidis]|uniref:Two-component system response regulator YesN n=1 Tax=Paenibacillus prosopidis TaxID=630520 RepID=A0A368W881_9BACL|nr:helix-turn-helix domain-containing protein [Paenibacillus prosopidis]RCW49475.1 two-component system response regulator YesN [Paenibacillus prosopidis]
MIKVLVVDDDKLVRKGLISAMPWADFGMQVVGEAGNGEKALEFLHANSVDLMLTDLAMPVMSGIELMRIARKLYPELYIVVLTLHQDFDYIQEALRLGAIDYIAKVQLEKERFEEVLERVYLRIQEERKKSAAGDPLSKEAANSDSFAADAGYAFLAKEDQPDTSWLAQTELLEGGILEESDVNVWWWVPEEAEAEPAQIQDGWIAMKLVGLAGQKKSLLYRLLRAYKQKDFFYDYHPNHKRVEMTVEALQKESPANESHLAAVREKWLTLEWIHEEAAYAQLRDELKAMRLPVPRLVQFLYTLESEWNRVYAAVTDKRLAEPGPFDSWLEAEAWLKSIRTLTAQITSSQSYSQEVVDCIMRAVKIVQEEMDQQVFAMDVAKRVNMSRSYFSQCFKDITGKSFNEYVREIRIEKAKAFLMHTHKPIQWIAEHTGYMDEKYFSRLFREHTGMLPSEFRQKPPG